MKRIGIIGVELYGRLEPSEPFKSFKPFKLFK